MPEITFHAGIMVSGYVALVVAVALSDRVEGTAKFWWFLGYVLSVPLLNVLWLVLAADSLARLPDLLEWALGYLLVPLLVYLFFLAKTKPPAAK